MTSNVVSPRKKTDGDGRRLSPEQAAAAAMVAEAKARGLELTGPNGLLKLFIKNVLETALNEEMTEHLGHEKNQVEPGLESTNVCNGSRGKTVISDAAGEVRIDVPWDREGTFEPQRLVSRRSTVDRSRIVRPARTGRVEVREGGVAAPTAFGVHRGHAVARPGGWRGQVADRGVAERASRGERRSSNPACSSAPQRSRSNSP
jgi:hypothetical protein